MNDFFAFCAYLLFMAHKEQIQFCKGVKKLFPQYFSGTTVVDVGSKNLNGSNRELFGGLFKKKCNYTGIDLSKGKNVNVVMRGHEYLKNYRRWFDVAITTSALEHDRFWHLTLTTMYTSLRPGGLLIITAAGNGFEEHGTTDHHAWASPDTNDYYKNISNEMFTSVLPSQLFSTYYLSQNPKDKNLNFYGIKI